MKMMATGVIQNLHLIIIHYNMAEEKNEITNSGVPNRSGLEVYMTITVGSDEFLIPIVATDQYGNAHKVLRRNLDNKVES